MNQRYPQPPTEKSLSGQAAHWVLQESLHGVIVTESVDPQGTPIDVAMRTRVATIVAAMRKAAEGADDLNIEKQLTMYETIHPQNWGTPDLFYWLGRFRLHVWDYKDGHDFVDAIENWQEINYVAGIFELFGIKGDLDQLIEVTFFIAQPNNYDREGPIRSWTVQGSALRSYFNRLQNAAHAAMQSERVATPGAHCLYCPGRHACAALQRSAYRIAYITAKGEPFNLPADQAGAELRLLEDANVTLQARIKGLRDEVERHYKNGDRSTGYVWESAAGRSKWTVPPEQTIEVGKLYGKDLSKPLDVLTPTQAKDAGVPAEVIASMSNRPMSSGRLIPLEDSIAHRAFNRK